MRQQRLVAQVAPLLRIAGPAQQVCMVAGRADLKYKALQAETRIT